jgi:hypothetical protein
MLAFMHYIGCIRRTVTKGKISKKPLAGTLREKFCQQKLLFPGSETKGREKINPPLALKPCKRIALLSDFRKT